MTAWLIRLSLHIHVRSKNSWRMLLHTPPPLAHVRKGLWLHNGASGQVRISRSRDRRGVRKQSDVRGGLGSRPAQGFFPQQGPAALFYPGSSGIPGMLGPNPKGGGTENKHTHSNLNPNLGWTQALPPQQCVYISGTWLCERCRWRSMEHERGTAVCVCCCWWSRRAWL